MIHNLRRFCAFLFAGVFFVFLSLSSHADGFLSILPEVPLPEKILEIAESEVSFDAPTGRIVQVIASGTKDKKSILNFYKVTMPQLGWTAQSATEFTRENEKLSLTLDTKNGETLVHFELAPTNTNNN